MNILDPWMDAHERWPLEEWVPIPICGLVKCPVCGGEIPPEEDDAMPWPFNINTYEPDPPEPECDAFGPITTKTKRL